KPRANWPGRAIPWHFRLRAQHVPGNEEHIGRTLAQPPHKIGIPFRAEGYVDPGAPAFANKLLLKIAANPVEHLELERLPWDLLPHGKGPTFPDQILVVRRQAVINAALHQRSHQLDVVGIDL